MSHLTEQLKFDDILNVVQCFYAKARFHPVIGHFFEAIGDFTFHENKIAAFWWTALGGRSAELPFDAPEIDMINKHLALNIRSPDLDIWLSLFDQTLYEELDEALAGIWQLRAHEIASHLKSLVINREPMGIKIKEPGTD